MSGLRTSLKDPDLQENVYVYDAAGRLVTEQLEAGKTVYFGYDASGMLTRRHMPQNVIIAYYDYDVAGRNTVNKQKGAFLDTRIYYRNKNGAIEVEDAGSSNFLYYGYDALDRLTSEKIQASGSISSNAYYAWDAASNRTIKTDEMGAGVRTYYTYDSRNLLSKEQILGGTSTYYDFDAAQRMTRQRAGAIVTYFGFTQRDQIARLHNVGLADPIQYFSYSGAGERIRVREGSTETYWSHDGDKLLRERQSTGTLVARYRHNMSPVPAGSNVMTYFRRSDTSEWVNVSPKYNHQGSVQVLSETDGTENALATYVYMNQFGATDLTSATAAAALRLLFAPSVPCLAALNVAQGAYLLRMGLWLPNAAISVLGAPPLGDDPKDEQLPAVWGEVGYPACFLGTPVVHLRKASSLTDLDLGTTDAGFTECARKFVGADPEPVPGAVGPVNDPIAGTNLTHLGVMFFYEFPVNNPEFCGYTFQEGGFYRERKFAPARQRRGEGPEPGSVIPSTGVFHRMFFRSPRDVIDGTLGRAYRANQAGPEEAWVDDPAPQKLYMVLHQSPRRSTKDHYSYSWIFCDIPGRNFRQGQAGFDISMWSKVTVRDLGLTGESVSAGLNYLSFGYRWSRESRAFVGGILGFDEYPKGDVF